MHGEMPGLRLLLEFYRHLHLEIAVAGDDDEFRHRWMDGYHLTSNAKISALRKGRPKQILSV
jgi:hypothetical protein